MIKNLELFNKHPNIDNYASMQSMKAWGYEFSDQEKQLFPFIEQGFENSKDDFIRPNRKHDPYDSDSYYRTWTKLSLDGLISASGLNVSESQSALHFLTEAYGSASTIIHHNAFNIWLFAHLGDKSDLMKQGYTFISERVTFTVLCRLANVIIGITESTKEIKKDNTKFLNDLKTIMDDYVKNNVK